MKNERRSERQTNRERKKTIAAYINRTKSMYWSSSIVRLVHWREIIGTCYMDDKSKSNQIWSTVDKNKQRQKKSIHSFFYLIEVTSDRYDWNVYNWIISTWTQFLCFFAFFQFTNCFEKCLNIPPTIVNIFSLDRSMTVIVAICKFLKISHEKKQLLNDC